VRVQGSVLPILSVVLCLMLLAVLLIMVGSDSHAQDSTLYVSSDGNCGGKSPCYATIQEAVDHASNGDSIKVAEGIYTGSGAQVVSITKSITVVGGYAVSDWENSDPSANPTIVDAQNAPGRRGIYVGGTSAEVKLAGLTVQHGDNPGGGGGIYAQQAVVSVEQCRLASNSAGGYRGGGLYAHDTALSMQDCEVLDNTAGSGGGVYVHNADETTTTLSHCTIQGNSASSRGGGVYLWKQYCPGHSVVENSTIQDNRTTDSGSKGGGVYAAGCVVVQGNSVASNTAALGVSENDENGGGIYAESLKNTTPGKEDGVPKILGNVIESNQANDSGGGIYLVSDRTTLAIVESTMLFLRTT